MTSLLMPTRQNSFVASAVCIGHKTCCTFVQDYSVSMYVRQEWRDPRLVFMPIHRKIVKVRLGEGSWDKIWIPDTFFRNEKRATFHEVTVNNRLLRLNATGFLWYVTK